VINIFDCSSINHYLYDILEYALNVEKISIKTDPKTSIDTHPNSSYLVTTTILSREHQIEIICPEESDLQFGYKLANATIDALEKRGLENSASKDFIRLRTVYKTLINRLPLVYEPPLIGWFFPDESYRMAILYGLIREIELWEKIELIIPRSNHNTQ
jgi:hypothetical protein